VPRDDDRTINSIGKHIKEYNYTKQLLQNKVYQYLKDENTCRSIFLLEYFGEKKENRCGICSNCTTQSISSKIDKQKLESDILQLLSSKPFNCNDLMNTLPYPNDQIDAALDKLFAMKKITFNIFNELCLK
jgi:ATP-dependent DNA helicase recQ